MWQALPRSTTAVGRGGRCWVCRVPSTAWPFLGVGRGVAQSKSPQQEALVWGPDEGLPHLGGSITQPHMAAQQQCWGSEHLGGGDGGLRVPGSSTLRMHRRVQRRWPGRRDGASRRDQGLGDKELTAEVFRAFWGVLGTLAETWRRTGTLRQGVKAVPGKSRGGRLVKRKDQGHSPSGAETQARPWPPWCPPDLCILSLP